MMSENDEEILADLLIKWEELHEQGQDVAATELCRDCPHLAPELARRIHSLKITAWLDKPLPAVSIQAHPPPFSSKLLAGRFRLDQLIAEGGFGQVWRAFDPVLKRTVAIKMPKHLGSVEAFISEARKVASLQHSGIVPIFDVCRDGDSCFLVSEFIEGGTLAERTNLQPEESGRIIAEIAETLNFAHQKGLVHRDIKPSNILLGHDGRALLTDFGIAVSTEENSGPSFGTLAFMAPEQIEGTTPDSRSDIFSLGIVLYQLLTGRLPYRTTDPNTLRREIVTGPVDLFPTPSSVPPELKRICRKCLAKNPSDRYSTAGQLAADLRRFGQGRSGAWKFLGGVALILLVAGGAIGLFLKNQPEEQPVAKINQKETPQPEKQAKQEKTPQPKQAQPEEHKQQKPPIKNPPPSLEATLSLGKRLFEGKNFQEAVPVYSQAIEINPNCAEAYHRRGAALYNLNKFQEALVDLDKAVELDPKNAELRRHRSLSLSLMRQYEQAIADLEEAIKLNPADQAACHKLLATNYFYLAAQHQKNQRWQDAVVISTLAIKYESSAFHFHQRGESYFNLKEFDKAVADFTEAIKLEPGNKSHYEKRALAYQALGKDEEARADWEKARMK